ncbi:MAG: universal stress protein E [Candidatus Azotimanducaceae bacterium]
MSRAVTSLLIVIDAQETEHAGLNRIKEMPADSFHFQIDLYVERRLLATSPAPSSTRALLPAETACQADDKDAWLTLLVQPLRDLGYSLDTAVIEFEQLHESIIERAGALGVGCILKPLRHHGLLRQLSFTPTDWQLVRQCAIPLWLVSHFYRLKGKPMLAAVDIAETEQSHVALNQRVLQQAAAVSALLHGPLHVVSAYSMAPLPVLADPLAVQAVERLRLDQMALARQVAFQHQIDSGRIHCELGSVNRVVNYTSQQIDAGVIVLGSTMRAGVSRSLGGSVAEAVMAETDSDVLIVKSGRESLSITV